MREFVFSFFNLRKQNRYTKQLKCEMEKVMVLNVDINDILVVESF